jgi:hypothetical protein
MNIQELKKIIFEEVKKTLNEEITEPSEQVLKGAMNVFKQNTGIVAGMPVFVGKSKRTGSIYYEINLDKEIRTNVMKALFTSLVLKVEARELPGVIGGYSFKFEFSYIHPNGNSNGLDIGLVFYKDNKYIAKF